MKTVETELLLFLLFCARFRSCSVLCGLKTCWKQSTARSQLYWIYFLHCL